MVDLVAEQIYDSITERSCERKRKRERKRQREKAIHSKRKASIEVKSFLSHSHCYDMKPSNKINHEYKMI